MRIVSQDGEYDLLYEGIHIWVDCNHFRPTICASPANGIEIYKLAEYSAAKRARAALDILRDACIMHENFKCQPPDIQIKILAHYKDKGDNDKMYMCGGVFRFPADEDIAV